MKNVKLDVVSIIICIYDIIIVYLYNIVGGILVI